MRILTIGGTRFVGRHLVEAALAAGHELTIFHRGSSGAELFPEAQHLTGDRNGDMAVLGAGSWDATIDTCAYFPRQIHDLADVLGDRGGQMVNISSVSVYAPPPVPWYDESSPLEVLDDPTVEEVTNTTYGGLKVLCERAALQRFGTGTLIARPTYVVGPHDHTWRFPWWVSRIARGGEVLAPGPADDPAQVIDARDLAAWLVSMIEQGSAGTFHTVGPRSALTWGQLLATIEACVAPPDTRLTWVDEDVLLAAGMDGSTLPLWAGGDPARLLSAADPSAAIVAGLTLRPLADTIADTLAWASSTVAPSGVGFDPATEARLLRDWHGRS
jgi:2'-hydroxyisoflavone reductase